LPCLIKNSSSKYSTNIKGDIYLVNDHTLSDLDDLESHPFLYKREEIIVIRTQTIKNGIPIKCWCYFFNDGYETDNIITDGEWK